VHAEGDIAAFIPVAARTDQLSHVAITE